MYCDKCGSDNSETASYCRKCGTAFTSEVETRVRSRSIVEPLVQAPAAPVPAYSAPGDHGDHPESEIFAISPTLKFIKAGYIAAAAGALFLVALSSAFLPFIPIWLSVILGLLMLLIPAFYHLRQKLVKYTLTDTKLEIDEGLISRTTRSVPIRRIQDVTVSSGVAQRLLGFGNLVIDNASEEGGKVVLKNIDTPKHYADLLLKQMRRLER
jgi:uncharacterized membrane protein YdbT with pleckstrin-like domain